MELNEAILLIALAVALAAWGLGQLVVSFTRNDKQKLHERLASEWKSDVNALLARAIVVERPLKDLPPWLAHNKVLRALNRKLRHAYPEAKLTRFLAICGAAGAAAFLTAALAMNSLLLGLAAGAGAAYCPVLVLSRKRARRQCLLADQLPEALDFLSRILRAGHSLSTGLQMMGDELPEPIASEFRRCYGQHSLGQPLEQTMREMANGVDSTDFAFFVTAVLIQRQTGGDLSEVLSHISTMIRSRVRLQQHVRAITAEGRLTGYILVAFPLVLFVVSYTLNPTYTGVLVKTSIGKMCLGGAFVLQALGLAFIRKIVNVKV